jgi:hypothetical protein
MRPLFSSCLSEALEEEDDDVEDEVEADDEKEEEKELPCCSMTGGKTRIEMAVSAVVPVLLPSILIFPTTGGEVTSASEAAALESSS